MSERPADAESLFAAWVEGAEAGAPGDFEQLVAAHPEFAGELRRMHDDWVVFAPILAGVVPGLLASDIGLPPLGSGAAAGADAANAPADELIQRIGIRMPDPARYRFRDTLGRGGGGVVLKVWDKKLHRHLAMKVVLGRGEARPAGDTPPVDAATITRFVDEARIASQLDHPGIVPVHELGTDGSGRAFFTMRLVDGEDLTRVFARVRDGSDGWTQVRALGVLAKACEAVAHAHERGVVHRDLKPANVMVGRHGEVHVMDWGLARVQGTALAPDRPDGPPQRIASVRAAERGAEPDSPLLTQDGALVGTPAYMAPEQANGQLQSVDARSDVYAIGAMLYELLAGSPPFVPRDEPTDALAIVERVRRGAPPSLERLAPRAPAELIAICDKAMARDPQDRYPDVRALNADLTAFLEQRVVTAYETGTWAAARKWARRNKGVVAGALSAFAALVVGTLVSLQQARRADASAHEATEAAERSRRLAADMAALAESEGAARRDVAARVREFDMLSGLVLYDEVMQRRDLLHPPWPEVIAAMDRWERDDARPLLAMKPDVAATLLDLRERASTRSDGDRAEELARDPRYPEWQRLQGFVACMRRAKAVRDGATPPPEAPPAVEIREDEWDATMTAVEAMTTLERASRASFGEEPRGLALARTLEAKTRGTSRHPRSLRVLAGALFAIGLHDEARAVAATLVAVDPDRAAAATFAESLASQIESFDADLTFLEDNLAMADAAMTGSATFFFPADAAGRAARFLGRALTELVEKIERVEKAVGEVQQRRRWAEAVRWISLDRPSSAEAWKRARDALAAADGAAAGGAAVNRVIDLSDEKVMGLVPIGANPRTGLWEFYDLRSAWDGAMDPADIPVPHHEADGSIRLREDTGIVFVLVPPCVARIGSQDTDAESPYYDPLRNDNEELQTVELGAYLISRYEMTQGQWERLMTWNDELRKPSQYYAGGALNGNAFTRLHPVEHVSWSMCMDLLTKHGMQMPSEAEWEHACRAGTTTPWWPGPRASDLAGVANVRDRTGARAVPSWGTPESFDDRHVVHAPVGSFAPNAFGLFDVHGNVMEWSRERLTTAGRVARGADGSLQPGPLAACRGGGFDGPALNARASIRALSLVDYRFGTLGVRPARKLD